VSFPEGAGVSQAEVKRVKELSRLKAELAKTESRLANPDFRTNAPPDVVKKLNDRGVELQAAIDRLEPTA
jgi:valyl-tRNA synthetase